MCYNLPEQLNLNNKIKIISIKEQKKKLKEMLEDDKNT